MDRRWICDLFPGDLQGRAQVLLPQIVDCHGE
jgi:hypothetical protein